MYVLFHCLLYQNSLTSQNSAVTYDSTTGRVSTSPFFCPLLS